MATLLDALSQENLDNQREVVKNEKRWSYDNRPYGSWQEKLQAHLYPPEHPYHHSTIGSMEDLDAASLEDVSAFFRTYYAPNNAVLSVVGDVDTRRRSGAASSATSARSRPTRPSRRSATCRCRPTLGGEIRETVYDRVPLPRIYVGFRAPVYGDPRLDALEVAGQILAGGKGSRLHRRLVRDERIAQDVALFTLGFIGGASMCAGWATVRPGVTVERVEAALHEETRAPRRRAGQRRRAGPGVRADRGGRARRPAAGRGTRRPAVDVRDAVRRPGPHQRDAAPLPGGHARSDPRGRGRDVPTGQPARPDLPARDAARRLRASTGRRPRTRPRRRPSRTRRWRHDRHGRASSATATSSRNARPRATRGPTTSRPSPETQLDNGLTVLVADLPGRPLVSATDRPARSAPSTSPRTRAARPSSPRGP